MIGTTGAVAAEILNVECTVITGYQNMLPGDAHQYILRQCRVEAAALDEGGRSGEKDLTTAWNYHPGFRCELRFRL